MRIGRAVEARHEKPAERELATIAVAYDGSPVIEAANAPGKSPQTEIPTDWEVVGFDRATVDLEGLRDHFTEASLLAACRRYLAIAGPADLRGVRFGKIVAVGKPASPKRVIQEVKAVARTISNPPHADAPWDENQDARLAHEWRSGRAVSELAQVFGRSQGGIRSRLTRLGFLDTNA